MTPEGTRAHGGENQLGQIVEALARFNLQNQAQMLAAQLFQVLQKLRNVGLRAHEGISHHVRVLHDELQRFQVLGSERRHVDPRLRKIDALFRAKFFAFRTRLRDFDRHGIIVDRANNAADFSIVKPDRIAALGVIENLRQ